MSIAYGSTLTLDDTGTNTNNRLGNGNNIIEFFGTGTLNLLGNSALTSSETFKSINFGRGEDVLNAVANGTGQANITLTSTGGAFTHGTLSSVVFDGTNLTSTAAVGAGNGTFTIGAIAAPFQGALETGGAPNQAILPRALAENSSTGTYTFATSSSTTGVIRQLAASETTPSLVSVYGYSGSAGDCVNDQRLGDGEHRQHVRSFRWRVCQRGGHCRGQLHQRDQQQHAIHPQR